jgi:hypothetical protein
MTLDQIPEKLRQPGLILCNGQKIKIILSDQQCEELTPLFLELEAQKKSESA